MSNSLPYERSQKQSEEQDGNNRSCQHYNMAAFCYPEGMLELITLGMLSGGQFVDWKALCGLSSLNRCSVIRGWGWGTEETAGNTLHLQVKDNNTGLIIRLND